MPPLLALAFCTTFVVYLLRLDRKLAPGVSTALWIPTLWFLSAASQPLAVWFDIGGTGPDTGSPLDRAFQLALLVLALTVLQWRRADWYTPLRKQPWLLLLLLYMLVSILWSDIPYISLKRWARQVVTVLMALVILTERNPKEALMSLFRRQVYILIPFSLVLIKYFPHWGVQFGRWSGELMWTGVAGQKNGLGCLCLFAVFFLLWTFVKTRKAEDSSKIRLHLPLEFSLLVLTIHLFLGPNRTLTYSVTSFVALVFGISIFVLLLRMKDSLSQFTKFALGCLLIILIVYGTVTPFAGKLVIFDISSLLNRDQSLTGRSDIWSKLVPLVMQRPAFGFGFGGFWTDAARQSIYSDGHNGYLDVLVDLGFVGLFFVSMFLVSFFQHAYKAVKQDLFWGCFALSFLFIAVVHNISESSLSWIASPMIAVLVFISFLLKHYDGSNICSVSISGPLMNRTDAEPPTSPSRAQRTLRVIRHTDIILHKLP